MQTTIRGLRTHYILQPGQKETVLFLHGWGAEIGLYQPIFDLLQSLGYGVAAFDMPGVGGTEEPQAPLTLSDYVGFTLDLCRELGLERCILMCHSNGGRIALRLLSERVSYGTEQPIRTIPLKIVVPPSLVVRDSTGEARID